MSILIALYLFLLTIDYENFDEMTVKGKLVTLINISLKGSSVNY